MEEAKIITSGEWTPQTGEVIYDESEFIRAKNDFNRMIKNSTKEDIEKAKSAFGISAMRFAMRYTNPNDNKILYDKIYNIYYDYFTLYLIRGGEREVSAT